MCNKIIRCPLFLWLGESVTEQASHVIRSRMLRDPHSILHANEAVHLLTPTKYSFHSYFVRRRRIELLSQPWQGRVLPLNQHRIKKHCSTRPLRREDAFYVMKIAKYGDNPVGTVHKRQ